MPHSDRPTRKYILLAVRILVAAAGVGYIFWSMTWTDQVRLPPGHGHPPGQYRVIEGDGRIFEAGGPIAIDIQGRPADVPVEGRGAGEADIQFEPGIVATIAKADWRLMLLGLVLIGVIYPMQGLRWMLLLHARGLNVTYFRSFRLVMVGCFFNYCMPLGTTGGDVVKAYYAAKGSGRNADAVISVLFDRFVGMIGLVLLCSTTSLLMLGDPKARPVGIFIWLMAAAIAVAIFIYFVPVIRKWFGVDLLLRIMPGKRIWQTIDQAVVAYRHRKRAVAAAIAIAIVIQGCIVLSTSAAGYALDVQHEFGLLAAVIPVIFLAGALPITYQGLGVMEGVGVPLLVAPGLCTANQLIAMLMLVRLYMVGFSMLGSLYLLRGDIHLHPQSDDDRDP